jgi:hypothetical protein
MRFQRDLQHAGINNDLPDLERKKNGSKTQLPKHKRSPKVKKWTTAQKLLQKKVWVNEDRWLNGLYSWQISAPVLPTRRFKTIRDMRKDELQLCKTWQWPKKAFLHIWPAIYVLLPHLILWVAIGTGILISYYVPPGVFRCRTYGELYFGIGWTISYILSKAITNMPQASVSQGIRFLLLLLKDCTVTALAVLWIFLTQFGWYNSPDCYMGHKTGLILPEQPNAYEELQIGLRVGGSFVTILSIGLLLQVILLGLCYCAYSSAMWTSVQRDDNAGEQDDSNSGSASNTSSAHEDAQDEEDHRH